MQGIPTILRTRHDYDSLLEQAKAGQIYPHHLPKLKAHFERLLTGRFEYQYDKELAENEEPTGEAPLYIVNEQKEQSQGEDGEQVTETKRVQYKRIESPTAEITTLGYTVKQVENIIAELEAL